MSSRCFWPSLAVLVFSTSSFAISNRPEILDSCGYALSGYVADEIHGMTEDEADQVLSSAYPNETLVSYREIDDKIDAINDGLNKIEVSLQIYEELKNKPHCESPSPERIEQLHKTHQDFALTLVALKKRRAQYFRSIEN